MLKWTALMLLIFSITIIGCSRETKEGSELNKGTVNKKEEASKDYSIKLLPESPSVADNIVAEVKIKGKGRLSGKLNFIWERNNQPIEGLSSNRIDGKSLKRGDVARVKIMPQGGEAKGDVFYSDSVVIQNALPVVATVKIKPDKNATKKDTLIATVEGKDPDGDTVSFKYQWVKNGTEDIEGANASTLSPAHFKHGDFINVRVTAYDGTAEGKPATSGYTAIINSAPEIVSQPPTETKGFNYIYKVSAIDLDKDNLNYSLSKAPSGMSIDSKSGEVRWNIKEGDEGSYNVEIIVEDGNGGRTVQGYLLTIKLPR
ncbi:MAG: Ig domain-containing protein [Nitrospirota bacterium]